MFGHTGEAFAKGCFLGSHPDWAVIGVTNAGHDAALSNHRNGPKAIFFGPEKGRYHNIPAGLETAIGSEQDAITQSVLQQRPMHFGQSQLPGTASVLDRAQR